MPSVRKFWWVGLLLLSIASPAEGNWRECRRSLGQLISVWGQQDLQRFAILPDQPSTANGSKIVTAELIQQNNQQVLDALGAMPGLRFEVMSDRMRRREEIPTALEIRRRMGQVQGSPRENGLMISLLDAPIPVHNDPSLPGLTHQLFPVGFQELNAQKYRLLVDTTSHLMGEGGRHYNGQDLITLSYRTNIRTLFHEMGHKDFYKGNGYRLINDVRSRKWWNQPMEPLLEKKAYEALGPDRIRIIAALAERGLPPLAINEIIAGQRELQIYGLDPPPEAAVRRAQTYTRSYISSALISKAKQLRLSRDELRALADGIHDYLQREDLNPPILQTGQVYLNSFPEAVKPVVFPDTQASIPPFRQPTPREQLPLARRLLPEKKVVLILAGGTVVAMVVTGGALLWDDETPDEKSDEKPVRRPVHKRRSLPIPR